MTETFIIMTEVEKSYKRKVATYKLMLRHNEELKAENFVTTKEECVVTIKVVE